MTALTRRQTLIGAAATVVAAALPAVVTADVANSEAGFDFIARIEPPEDV